MSEEKKNTECTKVELTDEELNDMVAGGAKKGEPRTDTGSKEKGILLPEI